MKILFLTHSFNSLAQRLYVELTRCGHEVAVELDINDAVIIQAVEIYQPALINAPFLNLLTALVYDVSISLDIRLRVLGTHDVI